MDDSVRKKMDKMRMGGGGDSFGSYDFPPVDTSGLDALAAKNAEMDQATVDIAAIKKAALASKVHDSLVRQIAEFDMSLDDDHEVGIRLADFGQSLLFHLDDLGYQNPNLLFFHCLDKTGNKVQLVQDTSRVNFLLIPLRKPDANRPARRFGPNSEPPPAKG